MAMEYLMPTTYAPTRLPERLLIQKDAMAVQSSLGVIMPLEAIVVP